LFIIFVTELSAVDTVTLFCPLKEKKKHYDYIMLTFKNLMKVKLLSTYFPSPAEALSEISEFELS
jgi:hypothetical protein